MPRSNATPAIRTVSVKNHTRMPDLSGATEAFSATIYLNGTRAGLAINRGDGGPNSYEFADPAQHKAFLAYARAWGEENGNPGEPEDALIDQLCEDFECRKRGRVVLAAGAIGLVLIYRKPGWFTGVPQEGEPDFYDESVVVGLRKSQDPADVAARHDAHAWRVVPTKNI